MPNLAPLVGQPLLNVSDFELRVDKSHTYTEDQLVPLVSMVWKLARFVDNRVHMQQAAGTTKGRYNTFYDYKNYQINGNQDFSGTKADREFWTHDTMDVEKDILKMKAHEPLLIKCNAARAPQGSGSSAPAQDSSPFRLSAKTKRNRRQHALYQKRKKAQKGQQSALSKPTNQAPAVTGKSNP